MTVDHIVPLAARPGDPDSPSNLALACGLCNLTKSTASTGFDDESRAQQPLFNPRLMQWDEHFEWASDFLSLIGQTAIGRATITRLRLNDNAYRMQRRLLRVMTLSGGPAWP